MKNNINIVLIEPEIPQNTGNIGRTCVGLNAKLHLVGQLGFSMDEKSLKRAGLDYWEKVNWQQYSDWDDFYSSREPHHDLIFLSTHGEKSLWDLSVKPPVYLVFGSESRGLPPSMYKKYKEKLVRIPVPGEIRSLNLATAVGIAAFEVARKFSC